MPCQPCHFDSQDVPAFTHKLPRIDAHFFMFTHNRDKSVPGPDGQTLLNSPKVRCRTSSPFT